MPDDPLIWLAAIVVGGAVVCVALALGGFVEVSLKPLRLSFRRKKGPSREKVSVLDKAEVEDAEVGTITGVLRENAGDDAQDINRDVDVARNAKIKRSKLGDISGVTIKDEKARRPKEDQR